LNERVAKRDASEPHDFTGGSPARSTTPKSLILFNQHYR
jgi:hypothetical protein